jgi:hypothetical protein
MVADSVRALDTNVELGSEGGPQASASRAVLLPGQRLGRYVVEKVAGVGGMGVAYVARDPVLDRRIILKLLRKDLATQGEAPGGEAQLLLEAQAMAKLSHPNVVTVHDVGAIDGEVFVAMEFVEGRTLRDWLSDRERSWREVVDVFLEAGRGLAAAHAVGIVHRDFKPSNVMVGLDARVRVTDFGLARQGGAGWEGLDPDSTPEDFSAWSRAMTLTRTGMLKGTPAYMAPEQFSGARATAQSDQFSFCVALFEGLLGRRPFEGSDSAGLRSAFSRGPSFLPTDRPVPPPVRDVLRRGLQANPSERFESLEALLSVLAENRAATARVPGRNRRAYGVAAGAAAVVLLAAVGLARSVAGKTAFSGTDDPLPSAAARQLDPAVTKAPLTGAAATEAAAPPAPSNAPNSEPTPPPAQTDAKRGVPSSNGEDVGEGAHRGAHAGATRARAKAKHSPSHAAAPNGAAAIDDAPLEPAFIRESSGVAR